MFDCYYEPEPDFKTVFHPEKGTKGMIQETFATAAAFCRIQNENNAVAWNNYFLMQDNTFLQQQIVDLKDENRLLMSKYTESDIHTLCTQIQQSYDDFCKHGIQEFKDRTLSGIAAFVKKCKENCSNYDENLKKQIKLSFEVCYEMLLRLCGNAKNGDTVYSVIKTVQSFFLEYQKYYDFDIKRFNSIAETVRSKNLSSSR